jgi:hypothetical protein
LASDVIRLIPFDPTKHTTHPVVEGRFGIFHANWCSATRVYLSNLCPTPRYLLRFSHPSHLQSFLASSNDIRVYGQHIIAKIFSQDADKSNLRPGTLLQKGTRPDNIMRHRDMYFRDFTGKAVVVLAEGIPMFATLGMITYQMQQLFENEHFEWAYEWANRPGAGDQFESNAVLVSTGYVFIKSWANE